jgi:predicted nuclease of predicted toxin-antitoxin system
MKLKLDENLPYGLSSTLGSLGHDVHTVYEENLTGHVDAEIWDSAQREGRFLLTQDLDFSDARKFIPGLHHGILLVRLKSPSRSDLLFRIEQLFKVENVGDWKGCFVVATDKKIRIQRPQGKLQ